MKRLIGFVVVVAVALLASASMVLAQDAASPKPPASDPGWDVSVYPILAYLPVMGINTRLPDAPPCTGCPPTKPPESHADSGLSGAAFVGFRVEKRRFSFEGLFNYAGLEASASTPFVDANLKVYIGSLKGGFMVVKDLYAEAGARHITLKVTASVLTYPEVTWKPGRWDPLVGVTYNPRLAKRWRLQARVDWAGLGGDAYSATTGQARVEWLPINHLLLTGGYGFSTEKVNGTVDAAQFGSKDIHLDYTLHGPVFGIGFHF